MELVAPFVMEAAQWLRDYVTAIRGGRWHPFTFVERKTRAATRNRTWGPTGTMLAELAELSQQQEHCQVIFAVLEYRIRSPEHKWLCVYKALQVLEYLIQRGSEHCCTAAQELLVPLAALQNFAYVGPDHKDYGQNVRLRAEAVKSLILDTEGLARKRAQLAARAANLKFAGFSREELLAGAAGGTPAACVKPDAPPTCIPAAAQTTGIVGDGSPGGDGNISVSAPATATPGSPSSGPLSPSSYRPPSVFLAASNARSGQATTALRGAGETKGITFEQNKRQLEQLRQLTLLEGNRTCADCASTVAAARPTWASINLGVFICMRCAGIHRGLGVHISKVRSTTLDTWLPEQVATMARLGNRRANAHFEAEMDPSLRPQRDNTIELERFIRLKYADKVWAAKAPWPPEDAEAAPQGAAAPPAITDGRQPSVTPLRAPPPPLPVASAVDRNPKEQPSALPSGAGSTGGGFGDAPPAWPSTAPSLNPPSSSQPSHGQPRPAIAKSAQGVVGTPQPSPAPAGKGGPVVPLLPPPPAPRSAGVGLGFGAGATEQPRGREGGVLASPSDLLQLDTDSDDDGDEGGGIADARAGAADGPGTGNAALWDLLDPTMDVMTWLDRVEDAQHKQQQQQLQQPPQQKPHEHQHAQHHRTPSAPVIGGFGSSAFMQAVASGEAALSGFLTPPVGHPPAGAACVGQVPARQLSGVGGPVAGTAQPAGAAVASNGPSSMTSTQSIIMTAEFPVYDLLTPLPTGGGAPMSRPPVVGGAAKGSQTGAAPWLVSTPPGSMSQTCPPEYLRQPAAPHSAPVLQSQHIGASGRGLSVTATTATTPTPAPAPPTAARALSNSLSSQRNSGMRSAGMTRGDGMGLRAGTAASATAPAPAVDLDNLLAMQLDGLGTSLAGGSGGSSVSAGRPIWQPAPAAVGTAIGGRR